MYFKLPIHDIYYELALDTDKDAGRSLFIEYFENGRFRPFLMN